MSESWIVLATSLVSELHQHAGKAATISPTYNLQGLRVGWRHGNSIVLTVLGKGLNARTGDQMEIEPIVPGANSTGLPKGQCQKLCRGTHGQCTRHDLSRMVPAMNGIKNGNTDNKVQFHGTFTSRS